MDRVEEVEEQAAALRLLAVLAVGDQPSRDHLDGALAEAAAFLRADATALVRLEPDAGVRVLARGGAAVALQPVDVGLVCRRVDEGAGYERLQIGGAEVLGAPVAVGGDGWGVLVASWSAGEAPRGAEDRLAYVADVVAGAVASTRARDRLRQMVAEESALRRVAELVARGADEGELFAAVAAEAAQLIDGEGTTLVRFDGPRTFTVLATCGGPAPVGLRVEIADDDAGTVGEVLRTGRAARRDDYQIRVGAQFDRADYGPGSSVSVPILVEDRVWGLLGTLTEHRRLPAETEERLQKFAELVAAAIATSQARTQVQWLADEQAALRRVAELVAHGAPEQELFEAVALEASRLVDREPTTLVRYEGARRFTILATSGGPAAPGLSVVVPADDEGALAQVIRHPDRPVRLDSYAAEPGPHFTRERFGVGSSVSVPILVDSRLWGALGVLTEGHPLPPDTEDRLQKFAELVAAALANSHARKEVTKLADEQTALRRVAELVAGSPPLQEVFQAVAVEASRSLEGLRAGLVRVDPDGSGTVVASFGSAVPLGLRLPGGGDTVFARVVRSGRAVRDDCYDQTSVVARVDGTQAAVGVPITVDGRVCAALVASAAGRDLPEGAERRLEEFAALAAAAIANAENRAALTASRARVVATADETRRRLQRDVHDGAQQRLIQTVITLEVAQDEIARGGSAAGLVDEALGHAVRATVELRDLVQGILPASLTRGGLRAGLESLVADLPLPVHVDLPDGRFATAVETTAYFIVAEGLTNVVKHARATRADVRVRVRGAALVVEVADDGAGGADAAGTGLTGLADRVEAAEGRLVVSSLPGRGTTLRAELPVGPAPGPSRASPTSGGPRGT